MASHLYPPPVSSRSGTAVTEREADRIEVTTSIAPRTGISPLAGQGASPRPIAPEHRRRSPRQDHHQRAVSPPIEQAEPQPPVLSNRFDYLSFEDEMLVAKASVGRRVVQGAILVALVAAVGSWIFMLPESDTSVSSTGAATAIETTDKPVATAELLAAATRPEVGGSLQSLASSGRLSGSDRAPSIGSPADGVGGFAIELADAIEENDVAESPTTTVWVEPTLPPESEWVSSGNGVLVPDLLLRIRFCESTNNYLAANSGSSARGAYQFLNKSWDWYGHAAITGVTEAHLATPAQQDEAGLRTLQKEGTGPWAESRACWADENIDPRYATAAPPPPVTTTTTAADTSSTTSDGSTTSAVETTVGGSSTTAVTETTVAPTTTVVDSTTSSSDPSTTTTAASSTTAAS